MTNTEIVLVEQVPVDTGKPVRIEGLFYTSKSPEKLQKLKEILIETIAIQCDISEESITITFKQ